MERGDGLFRVCLPSLWKADISYRRVWGPRCETDEIWYFGSGKSRNRRESHRRWNVLRQSHQSRTAIARIELVQSKFMNAMQIWGYYTSFSSVYLWVMWGCFGKLRLCQMGHCGSALWRRGEGETLQQLISTIFSISISILYWYKFYRKRHQQYSSMYINTIAMRGYINICQRPKLQDFVCNYFAAHFAP